MLPLPNQKNMLPLSFAVDMAGIQQQATVLEDCSDMAYFRYRVRFDNGIEDIFTIIEGPAIVIEAGESGHDQYATALTMDLYELSKIIPENFLSVLPFRLQGDLINVWLSEEEPDPGEKNSVMVSYGGHSGFQLYRVSENENWKSREYKPAPLTEEEKALALELAATMDTMYAPIPLK